MKIRFETTDYQMAHGRMPKGRGAWAFSVERNPTPEQVVFWANATYGDAKTRAKEFFKQTGATPVVWVLS